jgi:NADH-quinone oxidoreductase subunit H
MILMLQYSDITNLIHQALSSSLSPMATQVTEIILSALVAFIVMILCVIIMVYMERKVAGFMQLRLGPMRVGPYGTLQVFADVIKLLLKETFTPVKADQFMFNLAPCIVLMVSLMALAPISWGPGLIMWDSNIGVLFVTAITSLSVIGILMAGWSSNNKYSLLGAMRSGAQIVSYELSAGMAIVTAVTLSGTISSVGLVQSQADGWWIIKGHIPAFIAFITYVISLSLIHI